jgi:hypothetical protein
MTETETDAEPVTARDAAEVGADEALAAWVSAARPILVEAARSYRSVLTHKELAEAVQEHSGIHTQQRVHYWIDGVLASLGRECSAKDEPLLPALCVNREGSVGTSYAALVRELTGEEPADPDEHAAKERLACHRFFGAADLPPDGGFAALVPQLANARARVRKAEVAARPVRTCPTCHMELLPSGVCDTCG